MNAECPVCKHHYERDPGFFLGSIYFNYGVTAVLVTAGFLGLRFGAGVNSPWLLWGMALFCVVFPMWFFRYARCLWIAFDEFFDPADKPDDGTLKKQQRRP